MEPMDKTGLANLNNQRLDVSESALHGRFDSRNTISISDTIAHLLRLVNLVAWIHFRLCILLECFQGVFPGKSGRPRPSPGHTFPECALIIGDN